MEKWKFKEIVSEYEDAVITYRSTNSRKLKYKVCTLNFDNKYIKSKKNRAAESDDTVLLFCWYTDSYRLLEPTNITNIVPLQSMLRKKR